MRTHPRWTGICLLLLSIGAFSTMDLDEGGGVLGLCAFLLCFVSGWLVLFFLWNDGDVTRLRSLHGAAARVRAPPARPALDRTFRYPAMKGARLVVMVALGLFMLGMALVSLYVLASSAGRGAAGSRGVLYFVFGLFASCTVFFSWLTLRYARLFIRVDGQGITASTYLGQRQIGWGDVVALRDWIPFRGWEWIPGLSGMSELLAPDFTLYKLYTHDQLMTFSSSLLGAEELAGLIRSNAGLPDAGDAGRSPAPPSRQVGGGS